MSSLGFNDARWGKVAMVGLYPLLQGTVAVFEKPAIEANRDSLFKQRKREGEGTLPMLFTLAVDF